MSWADLQQWFPIIGGIWTAVLTAGTMLIGWKQKKDDNKLTVEKVKIEKEFDRQKDFQDDLIGECKALRDECKSLRDQLRQSNDQLNKANEQVMQQATSLAEKDRQMAGMQKEINELRAEVSTLEKKVAELESKGLKVVPA